MCPVPGLTPVPLSDSALFLTLTRAAAPEVLMPAPPLLERLLLLSSVTLNGDGADPATAEMPEPLEFDKLEFSMIVRMPRPVVWVLSSRRALPVVPRILTPSI